MTTEYTNVSFCPSCGSDNVATIEKRDGAKWVRRRRECNVCKTRYSTAEIPHEMLKSLRDQAADTKRLRAMLREAIGEPSKGPGRYESEWGKPEFQD